MKAITCVTAMGIVVGCLGCGPGPKSSRGFTLPDGDAIRGKAAYLEFRCYDCHRIGGVDLPDTQEPELPLVTIGGKVKYRANLGKVGDKKAVRIVEEVKKEEQQ